MTPHKCPVCEGEKEKYKDCGPCEGKGIVWDTDNPITFYPNPQPSIVPMPSLTPWYPWIYTPEPWTITWECATNIPPNTSGEPVIEVWN